MKVKLRFESWLSPSSNSERTPSEAIFVSAPEGESILGIVSSLVKDDPILWKSLFDEKDHIIQPNVIVILNNRIVNPYDRSEATLKEGDELTFLPMFDGG